MTKKQEDVTLVAKPADKELFVISYKGLGFATYVRDNTLDELLEVARQSLSKQEKENGTGQEEGKEVRTKGTKRSGKTA